METTTQEKKIVMRAKSYNASEGKYNYVNKKKYYYPEKMKELRAKYIAEKKYYCEGCDQVFGGKHLLDYHMTSNKHKIKSEGYEKVYPCELCNENFKTSAARFMHIKKSSMHKKMVALRSEE